MRRTEKRFVQEYESSIPKPHKNFEEIALKSGLSGKNDIAKPMRLRWFAIGAVSCLAIATAIVIPTAIHANNNTLVKGTVSFPIIKEGDYSFESESTHVNGYSLNGASITIELSEQEPTVGEFVIPKTDVNGRMIGIFSPCMLSDASFVFERTPSLSAFVYKAFSQNNIFYMTIEAEDSAHLRLKISNDNSIYCSALFLKK